MRRCSPIQAARTGSRLRDPTGESPGHITLPNMWCRAARTSCSSASITCTSPTDDGRPDPSIARVSCSSPGCQRRQ